MPLANNPGLQPWSTKMPIVYLNGKFVKQENAQISVLDRGFIFGDGIYEVIPAYGQKLFRFEEHMQRLQNSLDAIRIENPHSLLQWQQLLQQLVIQNEAEDQSVYMQITRGVAQRDHALPDNVIATVFAMTTPLTSADGNLLENGIAAITLEDIRWKNCHIKAISLLPNILLRQQAIDQNAAESLLIRNGLATEGAASNLFIVHNGSIVTPPKSANLLPGITRDLVLELADTHNIPYQQRNITEQELLQADEIWISSSTKEVLPVTTINGNNVATGKPGPLWQQMYQLFSEYKQSLK